MPGRNRRTGRPSRVERWQDTDLSSCSQDYRVAFGALLLVARNQEAYSAEECQIAELTCALAAFSATAEPENAPIRELSQDGNVFGITFGERHGGRSYRFYFGETAEADAERALRASEYVSELLTVVGRGYSCFVVPTEVSAPEPSVLLNRLGLRDRFTARLTEERESEEDHYGRYYELDVVVSVSAGKHYQRFHEVLSVTKTDREIEYSYKKKEGPTVGSEAERARLQGNGEQLSAILGQGCEDAAEILDILDGKNESYGSFNDQRRRMLQTLADAKDSELGKFLQELESDAVGQVDISPVSLFVGAVREKTFVYELTEKRTVTSEAGDPVRSATLAVTWNRAAEEFHRANLYIAVHSDGSFAGLTHARGFTDAAGTARERDLLSRNDELILMNRLQGSAVKQELTLRIPEGAALPYKGVSRRAVALSDVSPSVSGVARGELFLPDDTERLEDGVYLKSDVGTCKVTERRVWRGDLQKVLLTREGGDLLETEVDRNHIGRLSRGYCSHCGVGYYAPSAKELTQYRERFALLSGGCYCDRCRKDTVTETGPAHARGYVKLVKDLRLSSRNVFGADFVKTDANGTPLPLERGGNVFVCCHCNHVILHSNAGAAAHCDICDALLCRLCADNENEKKRETVYGIKNERLGRVCRACNAELRPGEGKPIGKYWLMRVLEKGEYSFNSRLVGVKDGITDCVFHCAVCQSPIYYNAAAEQDYKRCGCCGRLIGDKCYQEKLEKHPLLGVKLCPDCGKSIEDPAHAKGLELLANQYQKNENERILLESANSALRDGWRSAVVKDIERYLPHLSPRDRRFVKGVLKKGDGKREILVDVHDAVRTGKRSYAVRFDLSVHHPGGGARYYSFYDCSGKITLEGIRDGRK